jgi:serine/threonine protein phosphatase 1
MKIYAIGDVHGCLHELNVLLDEVKKDLKSEDLIVLVGDYIDRGPDSKGVVNRLIELQAAHENTICLKGNHEDMMLDFFKLEGNHGGYWVVNGGDTALESYGAATCYSRRFDGSAHLDADDGWTAKAVLQDHLPFFQNLKIRHETEKYIFVHAGFDLFATDETEEEQVHSNLWVRDGWLGMDHDLGKTVVHGHTPLRSGEPSFNVGDNTLYAINLDTGCVFGGYLSCVVIHDGQASPTETSMDVISVKHEGFSTSRRKIQ